MTTISNKRNRVLDYFIQNDEDEDLLEKMGFLGNEQEHLYGDCVKKRDAEYDYIFKKLSVNYTDLEIRYYFDDLGLEEIN
jgi:hypothetical protein